MDCTLIHPLFGKQSDLLSDLKAPDTARPVSRQPHDVSMAMYWANAGRKPAVSARATLLGREDNRARRSMVRSLLICPLSVRLRFPDSRKALCSTLRWKRQGMARRSSRRLEPGLATRTYLALALER